MENINESKTPISVKDNLWLTYWGKSYVGKCWVCAQEITVMGNDKFEVGHIQSKSNNGTDNIENLVPICKKCNGMGGMGKMNMIEYKNKYYSGDKYKVNSLIQPAPYLEQVNKDKLHAEKLIHNALDEIEKIKEKLKSDLQRSNILHSSEPTSANQRVDKTNIEEIINPIINPKLESDSIIKKKEITEKIISKLTPYNDENKTTEIRDNIKNICNSIAFDRPDILQRILSSPEFTKSEFSDKDNFIAGYNIKGTKIFVETNYTLSEGTRFYKKLKKFIESNKSVTENSLFK